MATVAQLFIDGFWAAGIYCLVALGFTVGYIPSRVFDFGLASWYTLSAYLAWRLADFGLNPVLSILVGALTIASLCGLTEMTLYRPLRERGGRPVAGLLLSLGVMAVVSNFGVLLFGDQPRYWRQFTGAPIDSLGASISPARLLTALVAYILIATTVVVFRRSGFERLVNAVGEDRTLAAALGLRPNRTTTVAVASGAFLGCLAAGLYGLDSGVRPEMGFQLLLFGVVSSLVSGGRRLGLVFLGAVGVVVLTKVGAWLTSSHWEQVFVFAILAAVLVLRAGALGTGGSAVGSLDRRAP